MTASHSARAAETPERAYSLFGQRIPAEKLAPGLHVVATPIGNLKDISLRALGALAGADAILAEDTRVTSKLLLHYGVTTPMIAYHEHNAARLRPQMEKYYYDSGKYASYLEQLGITYPPAPAK